MAAKGVNFSVLEVNRLELLDAGVVKNETVYYNFFLKMLLTKLGITDVHAASSLLFDNVWNTNYIMWIGGNFQWRWQWAFQ